MGHPAPGEVSRCVEKQIPGGNDRKKGNGVLGLFLMAGVGEAGILRTQKIISSSRS